MTADLVLTSAKLWDGRALDDEAVAVGDGRITATGSNRDMLAIAGEGARVLDVAGRRVIPGLIDSHLHLVRAGRTWTREVRWDGVRSLGAALARISEHAGTTDRGEWVPVVGGWHPNQFEERRPPTRAELDDAAPDHPVFVQRNYVEAFLNTRALVEMGWEEERSDGRVTEVADLALLRARMPSDDMEASTRGLLRELNRYGLTGAIDAAGFGMTEESYQPFFSVFAGGERGFRARLLVGAGRPGSEQEDFTRWLETVDLSSGDDYLRHIGAGELLVYAAHDMEGLVARDTSEQTGGLAALSQMLADRRWAVHLHAILDSSLRTVLDAWERVEPASLPGELRFAVCHAEQASEETLRRIQSLGVGVTLQAGMAFRGGDSVALWSSDQLRQAPPVRTMLDMGIPLAAGSDGTVAATPNPWPCIAWLVTGETVDGSAPRAPEQLIDIDEALRLYTNASAWFSFEEGTRGTLRPGSHADLAVLAQDPLRVDPTSLSSIESALTIVGGEIVHSTLDSASVAP
jgi:predicted amidohydrolase YtcJ